MSTRSLRARLERLPARPGADALCVHHGDLCEIGTRPLPEIYVMAIEARRRLGREVPPLDEHRAMTPAERRRYDERAAELIAEQEAKNERAVAALQAEAEARRVVDAAALHLPEGLS
ncbi:hypothetical protein [Actinacidiphila acidipaludis]|uniref:Uncharacterized protein n=1 Tax=Actinacidiphila acidipaludis TaxID=2873382 RepID=A0ABS7QBC5_9ACTN|nr:hypothetical protein [Streptomyces acidipaludis]MBY8879750.1 hypothetical protein [Streptomyces acidipaludis]